jgi:hypothetical protein
VINPQRLRCRLTGGHRFEGIMYRMDLGRSWTQCLRCRQWKERWRRGWLVNFEEIRALPGKEEG